jgi:hypothetical protein
MSFLLTMQLPNMSNHNSFIAGKPMHPMAHSHKQKKGTYVPFFFGEQMPA